MKFVETFLPQMIAVYSNFQGALIFLGASQTTRIYQVANIFSIISNGNSLRVPVAAFPYTLYNLAV